jgi:hypothetical protein
VQGDPGSKDERTWFREPNGCPRSDAVQVEINTRRPVERSTERRRQRTIRLEDYRRRPAGRLRINSYRSKHRNRTCLRVLRKTRDHPAEHRDHAKSPAACACNRSLT